LAECTSFTKAHTAYKKIYAQMVDLNELRVTPAMELARTIGDAVPLARLKSQRILDSLNAIRMRQETMDLDFLKQRGRREAREYLESLKGTSPFAAAVVVLYSLGGHAIPVDDLTVYVLRKEGIVEPQAGPSEVQGFLERHVAAADVRDFVELLNKYVVSKSSRVSLEKLPEMLYPKVEPSDPEVSAEAAEPEAKTEAEPAPAVLKDKKKTAAKSEPGKAAPKKSAAAKGEAKPAAKKSAAIKSEAEPVSKRPAKSASRPKTAAKEKSAKAKPAKEKANEEKAAKEKEKAAKEKAAAKPRRKKK
jgi:endonuclease III